LDEGWSNQQKCVSILVSKNIKEAEVVSTLKNVFANYKKTNSKVLILMFTSKEQYESQTGLWLALLSSEGENLFDIDIDQDQLQYLHAKPEDKFGLTEELRKNIYWQIGAEECRVNVEALKTFPYPDEHLPGWSFEEVRRQSEKQEKRKQMLLGAYKMEVVQKNGLTIEQLNEVSAEGKKKKWPVPPAPDIEKLIESMKTSRSPMGGDWTKLREGNFLAISKEVHDQADSLMRSKDEAALKEIFIRGLIQGATEGAEVYIEDWIFFSDLAKIHLKGDPRFYWVFKNALYYVETGNTANAPSSIAQNNVAVCKVDGISIDSQGAVIFVSHGTGFDPVKAGESICNGEVIRIYAPREPDGITPTNSTDVYDYRVRMRFSDGERILKNGDYISGEPQAALKEPIRAELAVRAVTPLNASSNVGHSYYKKLCDEVSLAFDSIVILDNDAGNKEALEGYKALLSKAKDAFSTTDLADKERMRKVIAQAERREREISKYLGGLQKLEMDRAKYLEVVASIRREFNSPETLSKWLHRSIRYDKEAPGGDYWQTPYETLDKRSGDCEDYALLAQALLSEIGISSRIISVAFMEGAEKKAHAICLFNEYGRYEFFSGAYLRKFSASSIEQLMDQAYPTWYAIRELDPRTKTRIDISKK
jgi:hypothetical protein